MAELLARLDDGEFFEHGEFVCVLAPPSSDDRCCRRRSVATLMQALCDELPPAQAARIAARITHDRAASCTNTR